MPICSQKGEKEGFREQYALIRTPRAEKRWVGEQRVPICAPKGKKEGFREQDALIRTPRAEKRWVGEQRVPICSPKAAASAGRGLRGRR